VNDCYLTPKGAFISVLLWRRQLTFDEIMMMSALH